MKRILTSGFIIFVICTSFTNKKIIQDYRNVYEGEYFCIRQCQVVNPERTNLVFKTDTATILVRKGVADSILNILINKISYQVKLKNGKMYPYPYGRWGGGRFFANDSIGFSVSAGKICNMCTYSGKKK